MSAINRHQDLPGQRHEALAEVVSLYYIDGLDQREIASRIGLSRSTVSRMITEARELGIVDIRINRPLPIDENIRQDALTCFPLKDALILSNENVRGPVLERVGALAAQYVETSLPQNGTIAISWGTSLAATVDALSGGRRNNVRVVQMIGASGSLHPDVDGSELARNMALKLGGTSIALNAPLIVDDPSLARALLRQDSVANVLDIAARADMALIGLGGMNPAISSLLRSGFATRDALERAVAMGTVGDAGGHMLSIDGEIVHSELSERMVGLDEARLRAIPTVIAVAVGLEKVDIIHAALRSGLVDVIASDTRTMSAVLSLTKTRSSINTAQPSTVRTTAPGDG
jgi:DNA-binding transcriptional regulator LsrR (DeoR family)